MGLLRRHNRCHHRSPLRHALAIAGVVAVLALAGCGSPVSAVGSAQTPTPTQSPFQGVPLNGTPAPAVSLPDQNGQMISLDQFRGHVIVLTFLDSHCTTQCPLTAQSLNQAAAALGPAAVAKVDWVALTVDPWHDTPASAKAFLAAQKVTVPLHWLLGTPTQMAPLWKAYHMAVIDTPGDVTHTVGVYVIDAQLREQAFLDEGFDPRMLAQDVNLLQANSGL